MQSAMLIGLAIVLATQSGAPTKAPRDFALRLEFGCAVPDVINTTAGTYEMARWSGPRQIARVNVSSKLKDELFNLITEHQFFSLGPTVGDLGVCEPATRYNLWVTSNGKSHRVSWADCGMSPASEEGRRVRALGEGIVRPFHDMGAVKHLLQSPRVFCL